MPRVNGAEFRAAQRGEPSIAEIPTVVMTAGDRMSERVAEIAPNDTIAKPIELSRLFSVVAHYCGEA
jgi:CheY-like chemotaxis protein